MARKKKTVKVPLFKHGLIWWMLVGWWWHPCVFLFWIFYNVIFNDRVEFVKQR